MYRLSLYSPISRWKKGEYPVSPFVHLSIGMHVIQDDKVLLSAQLMTEGEIDETVDSLKSELEEFRKKAKAEIKRLEEKMCSP